MLFFKAEYFPGHSLRGKCFSEAGPPIFLTMILPGTFILLLRRSYQDPEELTECRNWTNLLVLKTKM